MGCGAATPAGAPEAAPGLAEDVDFLLAEAFAQILRQFEPISQKALRRDGREIGGSIGFAGARLIPVDDNEVFFEFAQVPPGHHQLAAARPTREEQQHRLRGTVTANGHPLPATAQLNRLQRGDAAGNRPAVGAANRRCGGKQVRKHD